MSRNLAITNGFHVGGSSKTEELMQKLEF